MPVGSDASGGWPRPLVAGQSTRTALKVAVHVCAEAPAAEADCHDGSRDDTGCSRLGVQPIPAGRLQRSGLAPCSHLPGLGYVTAGEPSWLHLLPDGPHRLGSESRASDRSELPVPTEDDERIGWFAEQRTAVLAALEATPDDALVWNFAAGGAAPASFWPRRMAQETLIHRVDAELAQSLTPALGDPEVAADNIAEFFELFFPRFEARLLESGPAGSLHLHATDVPQAEWTIELRPGGSVITREHTRGDASVRGSAFDLACWAWRRLPAERLEIFGDPQIAIRFHEAARL